VFPFATFFLIPMAFIFYNGHAHPPGQASAQFHFDAVLSEGEQIVAYKARADITGMLIGKGESPAETQADLTVQIQALQDAYVNGGDLILILDDGSQSPNSIINSATLGGTRVVQKPSFPDGGAAQYATIRNFAIAIEAEVPTIDGATALWSFEESLTFEGSGGPAYDVIEVVQGLAVPQQLKQFTAARAVQSGRAVGYLGYWTQMFADPIFPALEQQQFRVQQAMSAKRTGSSSNIAFKMFPSIWRYTFKSPTPLAGSPNPWPA
jgi:hypothetical protein